MTGPEKRASIRASGFHHGPSAYEYDHLISLELGGAANDSRNLWPENGASPNLKDKVENSLHVRVCDGRVSLARAQRIIALDWVSFYKRNVRPNPKSKPKPPTSPGPPHEGVVHPGAFCAPQGATGHTHHRHPDGVRPGFRRSQPLASRVTDSRHTTGHHSGNGTRPEIAASRPLLPRTFPRHVDATACHSYAAAMDPTAILTSAVAGAAGVGAGYLGMRAQAQTMRRQLKDSRKREREQRTQKLLDGRADSYHQLLNVETSLRRMLAAGELGESEYSTWISEFEALQHLVVLSGTEPVRVQADGLLIMYTRIERDRREGQERRTSRHRRSARKSPTDDDGFADVLRLAFQRHEPELERARKGLINAMRDDVAPDQQRSSTEQALETPAALALKTGAIPRAQLAVISTATGISDADAQRVIGAVQKQIERDFAPRWDLTADLMLYSHEEQVPPSAWPVIITDDIHDPDRVSFHTVASDGRPITVVRAVEGWEQRFSHECLEMLVSPYADFVIEVPSPNPDQARGLLLVQVCDACASQEFAYEIDGVPVADFCFPEYLDPGPVMAKQLDHENALEEPLAIRRGGHCTWYDPASRHLYQCSVDEERTYSDIGMFASFGATAALLKPPVSVAFFGAP